MDTIIIIYRENRQLANKGIVTNPCKICENGLANKTSMPYSKQNASRTQINKYLTNCCETESIWSEAFVFNIYKFQRTMKAKTHGLL